MTDNYHTPPVDGAPANMSVIRSPLSELDEAITGHEARIGVLEADVPVPPGNPTEYYNGDGEWTVPAGTGASVDGHVIKDEGVSLPQRASIDFVGAGVTVTNEAGGTQVSIPGGASIDGHVIKDEGVSLPQRASIDFVGAGVTVTNEAGGTQVSIAGGVQSVVAGANISIDNTDPANPVVSTLGGGGKNVMRNSGMRFSHRGGGPFTSASIFPNNDDTYLIDDWIFLADGSDTCDVSLVADNDFASGYKYRLDVETANRRFGIFQVVCKADMQDIRRAALASLRFKVKCTGTSMSNVRVYLLSWTGTANVVTSDCIVSWGSAGSDPTFAANWTKENTASNLPISVSIAENIIEGIVVDTASVNNLGVLIIVDDTDATIGDYLEFGDVKLEAGAVSTDYINEPYEADLAQTRFYIRKSYNLSVAPGTATSTGSIYASESPQTTGYLCSSLHFPPMASTPTFTIYDMAGNAGKCSRGVMGVSEDNNQNVLIASAAQNGINFLYSTGVSNSKYMAFQYLASAEL